MNGRTNYVFFSLQPPQGASPCPEWYSVLPIFVKPKQLASRSACPQGKDSRNVSTDWQTWPQRKKCISQS